MKTLVGIDFSLNSPAFCILKNNQFQFGSLTRSERTAESHKKTKVKPFAILDEVDMVDLIFMNKKPIPKDYVERERIKIDYFIELVDKFWSMILKLVGDDDFMVAIEGLSFASNGNALIDISMATALLRKEIIEIVGSENFYVFSPTTVKKFAFKGNAKKHELYDAMINHKDDETNLEIFTTILADNKEEWITKSLAINKPIDDLIDAFWVTLFLKSHFSEEKKIYRF